MAMYDALSRTHADNSGGKGGKKSTGKNKSHAGSGPSGGPRRRGRATSCQGNKLDEKTYAGNSGDQQLNATSSSLDFRTPSEWISFFAGILIVGLGGPPVGIVVLCGMLWEAVDRVSELLILRDDFRKTLSLSLSLTLSLSYSLSLYFHYMPY